MQRPHPVKWRHVFSGGWHCARKGPVGVLTSDCTTNGWHAEGCCCSGTRPWETCLLMVSPQPPSCSVMVGSWFMSQDLSAPCLPPGICMRSGEVGRWSKLGPALGIKCWKVGLPLSALSGPLLPVSHGYQFHLIRALCGRWKRQPWSWAMAGSALCLRRRKETGKRAGCLCYQLSLR